MLYKSKAFQITLWILMIFLIIWVLQYIGYIFHPIEVLIKTIFFPFLVAGVLYYLTISVVDWLEQFKIPRTIAILMIFVVFILLILFAILYLSPILQRQLTGLITNLPRFLTEFNRRLQEFQESTFFAEFEEFEFFQNLSTIDYVKLVDGLIATISQNIWTFIGSVANFVIVSLTIPLLLFYMLKEGSSLTPKIVSFFPEQYQGEAKTVLSEMNHTIRSYIQGMVIISLFIGGVVYIGYLIIGLDYALLLAAIAVITNIIPYFGPVLGTIPGVIVALFMSPLKALEVVVIMVIANYLENHLIAPLVLGRKLSIHPVTIIVVLLTAGSLGGIGAVILGVPAYAIVKVIATHTYSFTKRLIQERKLAGR
ncbi:MAG: AI-2E family transporter [Candidatus Wallacebacter cryptica]|jgi:predicted PurR-regulated permease PerM|nr:AI-2E family transporter [Bacillota bacterium]